MLSKSLFILSLFFFPLYGGDYCVIVSSASEISELSTMQIRNIYLKKYRFIGTQKAVPVNVLSEQKIRLLFEKKVLQIDRERLNEYWIKQHFIGITPPITQRSFESVRLFVQNVPGALGYIPKNLLTPQVKVVYEF